MIVYIIELFCITFDIVAGFNSLKSNHKVVAIINFSLAAILIILTVIMIVQDIRTYFYNKEIRKKYENKEQKNDRT